MESSPNESLDYGMMGYGCQHYRRRCKIRAPCCNEIFSCRHCHNETAAMLRNPSDRHELVRQDVKQVVCSVCDTEQHVGQVCANCEVRMGEYFCSICKFYDDDTAKGQFHCDDCGICRVGGRENFFHCKKCGSCYSIGLQNNHSCVENSMHHPCPICYEYLFDSLKVTTVMKCGHTMHHECLTEMLKREKYCCPICSRSVIDMSRTWKRLDKEIEATIMPEDYRYKKGGEALPVWPGNGSMQTVASQSTLRCLSRMLEEAIHSDVTISTSEGPLRAHKAVLAASSPVFQGMFRHDLREKESSTIYIEDMSLESCMALLSYLYGKIQQEDFWKHRLALLGAANKYGMADLKDACEESLMEDISSSNVLERLQEAWLYQLDKLKKGCLVFLFEFGKVYDVREEINNFFKQADRELMLEMFQEVLTVWKPN